MAEILDKSVVTPTLKTRTFTPTRLLSDAEALEREDMDPTKMVPAVSAQANTTGPVATGYLNHLISGKSGDQYVRATGALSQRFGSILPTPVAGPSSFDQYVPGGRQDTAEEASDNSSQDDGAGRAPTWDSDSTSKTSKMPQPLAARLKGSKVDADKLAGIQQALVASFRGGETSEVRRVNLQHTKPAGLARRVFARASMWF